MLTPYMYQPRTWKTKEIGLLGHYGPNWETSSFGTTHGPTRENEMVKSLALDFAAQLPPKPPRFILHQHGLPSRIAIVTFKQPQKQRGVHLIGSQGHSEGHFRLPRLWASEPLRNPALLPSALATRNSRPDPAQPSTKAAKTAAHMAQGGDPAPKICGLRRNTKRAEASCFLLINPLELILEKTRLPLPQVPLNYMKMAGVGGSGASLTPTGPEKTVSSF